MRVDPLVALAKLYALILDDWALHALDQQAREDLLEVVDDRAERRATLITAQLPIEHWHGWIGEPTIADAIPDRLLHQAHRITLKSRILTPKRQRPKTPHRTVSRHQIGKVVTTSVTI
jgi:DNA replication protein DnaC